eukprot:834539-Amphidinium_carterae.2
MSLPSELSCERLFMKIFGRYVRRSCAIYRMARAIDLHVEKVRLAKAKRCALDDSTLRDVPFSTVLSGAHHQRMLAYQEHLQLQSLEHGVQLDAAWVDLGQTVQFMNRVSDACPALLKNSFKYDLVANRPLVLSELYIAMGYPCPDIDVSKLSEEEAQKIQELSEHFWSWKTWTGDSWPQRPCKHLIGNAMHLHAIGTCHGLSSEVLRLHLASRARAMRMWRTSCNGALIEKEWSEHAWE